MGDFITGLPVDQIVPSKDEKEILDTMFVPSGPTPTTTIRMPRKPVDAGPHHVMDLQPTMVPGAAVPMPSSSPRQVKKSFQKELGTAISLAVLFLVCALPYWDTMWFSMLPFLRQSGIWCLVCKAVVFMMIAYLMLNWEILKVSSPPKGPTDVATYD